MQRQTLKAYYILTKPGIIRANVLTAIAGYLYGSAWDIDLSVLIGLIAGITLIIGGACVYNNVMDRDFDKRMKRTKQRALVTGVVSVRAALLYGTILTAVGFFLLGWLTNMEAVLIGIIGIIDYLFLYGWAKRNTPFSTIIGSVSGSTSIVAGYCAATNRFDIDALLLFVILTLWQMPHFYAIAMYRKNDYTNIEVPLMPLLKSAETAKQRIILYIAALLIASVLLTIVGKAGIVSLCILLILNSYWLFLAFKHKALVPDTWGKKMFLFSLIVNLGISLAVAIGTITP
jgi:protoheme IX farnesyltransferase